MDSLRRATFLVSGWTTRIETRSRDLRRWTILRSDQCYDRARHDEQGHLRSSGNLSRRYSLGLRRCRADPEVVQPAGSLSGVSAASGALRPDAALLGSTWRVLRQLSPRDWLIVTLVALCGGILGTFAIVKALFLVDFNQLSVVVLLQKLQPVFAIVLAGIVLKERITPRFLLWAAIALAGAYLLTFGLRLPVADGTSRTTAAAIWAAVAAAAFGSATVFGKRLLGVVDFREATFARYGITSLFAFAGLMIGGIGLPIRLITPMNWLVIGIIGLTTGSGAIFLYYFGLSNVRAIVAAICELCLPLSAIVFDYVINDSILGPWQWLGVLVLIVAISRVSTRPRSKPLQEST